MLPGVVDPALAASMLSAGFGAEQPGRLDDQGALQAASVLRSTPLCLHHVPHLASWVPRPTLVSPNRLTRLEHV